MKSIYALLLLSLVGLSRPVAASTLTPKEQQWVGIGLVAGTTAAHGLIWSLYPDRTSPLAPHFVPVVGPIVGFRDIAETPCTDERHGCPMRGMLVIYDTLYLGGQVAGLTMLTVSALRGREAGAVRIAPGAVSVRVRF